MEDNEEMFDTDWWVKINTELLVLILANTEGDCDQLKQYIHLNLY